MTVKKRWLAALMTVLAVGSLAGCGSSNAGSGKVLGKASTSKKAASKSSQSEATSSDKSALKKAEATLKEAQALNADGKYKQSNKKLSAIDLADLNKQSFSALKTEFFTLQKSNDKFLLKKSKTNSSQKTTKGGAKTAATTKSLPATNNSFDSYSKFVGDYTFYNYDSDRLQSDLSISSDGTVVQNNTDGSAFHGVATVKASGASGILSYDVTTDTNDTKSIKADVEIDVTWSGGDHETYYGYTSYDNYSVLTDGKSYDGDLVNEVWVQ